MSRLQNKLLTIFSFIMIVLNTYALYDNIMYYAESHHDFIESGMLLFTVITQAYAIYIFFLFRALKINYFDKVIIYTIGSISIILNFYYLLFDAKWNNHIVIDIFWMIYNTSMILFALIIFHFLSHYMTPTRAIL
ncbi:hypothetical protein L3V82_12255 [Thiotrichales bacterium 19S3-7]|nr:hypothetical protein [Thiotrichales bacterium 19S3-7]MCF6802962.1 hypothetical protein [Thiotrichales bacterium 19S3-11]